jgi:hypothetical protein
MAMSPPPFQLHLPCYHTSSCMAIALPLLQLHMLLPLCHLHKLHYSISCSWTLYAAAPIAAMYTALPLHRPHRPPHSHTALPCISQLGMLCCPLSLSHTSYCMSPHISQLDGPHCPLPCSYICYITMHLIARQAMSLPPLQLHYGMT